MFEGYNREVLFHLPGFEFARIYRNLLNLYKTNKKYFYNNAIIQSIYGSPGTSWDGGRVVHGGEFERYFEEIKQISREFNIPIKLTFTSSMINLDTLNDRYCNKILDDLSKDNMNHGIILTSDILKEYINNKYYGVFEFVSSTTKCITNIDVLNSELEKFDIVVLDFRLNKDIDFLKNIKKKHKLEILVNEKCNENCRRRELCYKHISDDNSRKNYSSYNNKFDLNNRFNNKNIFESEEYKKLESLPCSQHNESLNSLMNTPMFVTKEYINNIYRPMDIKNFKINGRCMNPENVVDYICYYLIKEEYIDEVKHILMRA